MPNRAHTTSIALPMECEQFDYTSGSGSPHSTSSFVYDGSMRVKPRFSLKMLLLFVTATASLCGYYANWIHRRHLLLEKYFTMKCDWFARHHIYGFGESLPSKVESIPWMLSLFGEESHDLIDVMISSNDVPQNQNDREAYSAEERRLAAALFPEAKLSVHLYVPDPESEAVPIDADFQSRIRHLQRCQGVVTVWGHP